MSLPINRVLLLVFTTLMLIIGAVAMFQPEQLRDSVFVFSPLLIIFAVLAVGLPFGLCLRQQTKRTTYVTSDNKAVVITGCDSGFGHSLALRLHSQGYVVYACCLFAQQEGAKQLRDVESDRMHVLQLDVTCESQVREAMEYVKSHLGDSQLWALVNNAGIASFSEIEWTSVTMFQRIMDVNVMGVVRVTKAFLPMLRMIQGRVINVASLSGRYTIPAFSAYSMSKVACIAFSDGLRQEMSKFGIKVITVEPGLYKTPIATNTMKDSEKSWAETPTDIKEVYGEEYFKEFVTIIKSQMKRARENVEEVVDLMVHAVTSTDPKSRYVPYWKTNIRATILMYLPSFLRDKLFKSYTVQVEPKCMHKNC